MNNEQIEYNHKFGNTLRFQIQALRANFARTGDHLYYVAANLKLRELRVLMNK